ncbi:MAG TPA: oligosaccharide flippase family protein [Verrucomicrobiae bacterium]|nr:oligosaccharide flippase family protein [Verrucomicrobiae bacterium]
MAASLKIPLAINFAGRFLSGLASFLATPLYLRWMGAEAYGLVGFYLLLQAGLGFFSAGLTNAANREIAAQEQAGERQIAAKLIGFKRAAWLLGALTGLILIAASGWLATRWLRLDHINAVTASKAIRLMSGLIALQLPLDFYAGALLGLRRYLKANLVLAGTAMARAAAAIFALACVSTTIEAFFWSQLAASIVIIFICELDLRTVTTAEKDSHGKLPWASLRESFRFSAGMTAIAFTGMILSQADRIVISRALKLDEFGFYSLAMTLANMLYFLIGPVQTTYYPEFSRHTAPEQRGQLAMLYHQGCQRMAVLVMPAGAMLVFFARDILALWTSRPDFAERTAPVVMFLVGARLIGCMISLPYTLQFAHGWTALVLTCNLAAIVIFIPVIYLLALQFGPVGAAAGYFLLSLPFLGVIIWRMHRRLLPGEAGSWFWHDTSLPVLLAMAAAGAWKFFQPASLTPVSRWLWLGLAGGSTFILVAAANPATRHQIMRFLHLRKLNVS